MDKKIIEKFFNNTSTQEEARRILDWFDTPEGREYLEKRLDADFDLMDEKEIKTLISEIDSERIYDSIQKKILTRKSNEKRKRDLLGPVLKIAAAILVILSASFFFSETYEPEPEQVVQQEPIHYQTSEDQQREITLGDGTVIRLNQNSEILISGNFMDESRKVTLTGEAYFDVEYNPDIPFVIYANQSRIEVLGTAFNVKSKDDQDNVQVAVVEGRVSFASTQSSLEEHSVILKRGQFGFLDVNERTISVDDYALESYLAWRTGRLIFEDLTLSQICKQLNRLYEIHCSFENEAIRDLRLTANFSNDSLEKTLSVISLSLKIDYTEEGSRVVHWRGNKDDVKTHFKN